MIIFFDGPDQSKKSSLAHSISVSLEIPIWQRGPYLPHHHGKDLHDEDAIYYIVDELRTIELFKKIGENVIVDRHPMVSDMVYRRIEGKTSPFENVPARVDSQEFVVLCHNGAMEPLTVETYKRVLSKRGLEYIVVDTSDAVRAFEFLLGKIEQVIR